MKILFVMRHGGYVRNYESVLRQLAAEGHRIHLAAELDRNKMGEDIVGQTLAREIPSITMGRAPVPEDGVWPRSAHISRLLVDALRYMQPQFRKAYALRTRAERIVPRTFRPFLYAVERLGSGCSRFVAAALCALERVIPLSREVTAFLQAEAPDALLVTPLVDPASIQVDYLKSASALGVPCALCVASWDNLTNKGAIRVVPDRVFVWNAAQIEETVALHGVPRERVVMTGAQIFDHWFSWRPSRTREEFCRTVGLDPSRPIVLYLGSSFFIAPNEADFGIRWLSALRAARDEQVAGANILIRPHPSNAAQWGGLNLELWPRTAVWPPPGVDFFAPEFKHDFYDSLHFSAAVVGVNTSAQVEAAILGRIVCTVASTDFAHSQAGTLHFQHLVNGGLVEIARDFDEHVAHLGALLRGGLAQAERSRAFVESFVRPFGLDQPATPRLTSAIVDLAALLVRRRSPDTLLVRVLRQLLTPVAWLVAGMPDRRPWWVYVLRPPLFLTVQAWALPYRVRNRQLLAARRLPQLQRDVEKRTRRLVVDPWKEGSKRVRSKTRYGLHRCRVNARVVGARVLRTLTK
ncbi:MAG: hypothetical protein HYX77_04190 [Acidobacteria bacterium]|nr:hypothetical protein [Acidobacteriota bacterium]